MAPGSRGVSQHDGGHSANPSAGGGIRRMPSRRGVLRPPDAAPTPAARALVWVLVAGVVALNIAYPLTTGAARDGVTVATVLVFAAASLLHGASARGWRSALAVLLVAAGGGLAVEALGVATGFPFGTYAYAPERLGPELLGVPLVIPLAWAMMAYPALLVGRQITTRRAWRPLAAGAALASWDLFLDPQMVAAGYWTWASSAVPRLAGIPVTNFVAWLVIAVAMMTLLDRLVAEGRADDRPLLALYVWVYGGSVLAHAVFLDLPASAVVGGVGMGAVVAAWGVQARRPHLPA